MSHRRHQQTTCKLPLAIEASLNLQARDDDEGAIAFDIPVLSFIDDMTLYL